MLTGKWFTKEVRIEGIVHMGEKMVPALKLMEYNRVNVKPVITEIIPLDEAQRAFDSLHEAKNVAVLLKPWTPEFWQIRLQKLYYFLAWGIPEL